MSAQGHRQVMDNLTTMNACLIVTLALVALMGLLG